MARGKESSQHKVIVEALAIHLSALFKTKPSIGAQISNDLKPDIYIEHPDGRKWAYEAVYMHQDPSQVYAKHARYCDAGVCDHWILWEDIRPHRRKRKADEGQLFFIDMEDSFLHQPSELQKAILQIQTGDERFLYAFNARLPKTIDNLPATLLARSASIGIDIYNIQSSNAGPKYLVHHEYHPLYEVQYGENGKFLPPPLATTRLLMEVFQHSEFADPGFSPEEQYARLHDMLTSSPERILILVRTYFERIFYQYFPETSPAEMETGLNSVMKTFESFSSPIEVAKAFNSPESLDQILRQTEEIIGRLNNYPAYLQQIFIPLFSILNLSTPALMKMAATSAALNAVRNPSR